ncbi:TetR/AcrR family transcriptional regulator [Paenarthrobacter sp. YAF11_1]|uniref:TetR/AcrR family transcriptional regulator n=1 Tax=Paenarthrobacter sp. YAF11_1 TaxID=3233074 RepID=UPI003F96ECB6
MANDHQPAAFRRRQFIEAAVQVISREGMAKATTRKIAEVAGLPAANLHYCFATKEDLLQAVYEYASSTGLTNIDVTPGVGLHQGIEDIVRSFAKWMLSGRDIQITLYEFAFWSLRNPESSHLAGRAYRRGLDFCAQLLREVRREDESDVDVEMLARLVIGALDGFALQWLTLDDGSGMRMLDTSVRMIQSTLPMAVTPA